MNSVLEENVWLREMAQELINAKRERDEAPQPLADLRWARAAIQIDFIIDRMAVVARSGLLPQPMPSWGPQRGSTRLKHPEYNPRDPQSYEGCIPIRIPKP